MSHFPLQRTAYPIPSHSSRGKKIVNNSRKSMNCQYLLSPSMIKASMEKRRSMKHRPAIKSYRLFGKWNIHTHTLKSINHMEQEVSAQQSRPRQRSMWWSGKVTKRRQDMNNKWKGGGLQVAKIWGRINSLQGSSTGKSRKEWLTGDEERIEWRRWGTTQVAQNGGEEYRCSKSLISWISGSSSGK